jgi:hypothetical protein
VFFTVACFQPSRIFAGKAGAYPNSLPWGNDTPHNDMLSVILIVMLSVVMQRSAFCCAECHIFKVLLRVVMLCITFYGYANCRYDEYHILYCIAKCRMPSTT